MNYKIDKSLWKTDDKEWMAQRKEEWKHVLKSLNVIRDEDNSEIKKKLFKYHKELFFTGEYNISKEDELNFERPFPSELLFLLWYYPDKSLDKYISIIDSYMDGLRNVLYREKKPLEYSIGARNYFMSISCKIGFDSDYGFMGGREELLVQALFPSLDYNDTIDIIDESGNNKAEVHLGPKSEDIYMYAIAPIYAWFKGSPNNKYLPSQYFWRYLDYLLSVNDNCLNTHAKEVLTFVLYILKHTDEFKKFPKDTKHVVEFANKLRLQFENNEFGDVLMGYWNNAEKLYAEYMEEYEE